MTTPLRISIAGLGTVGSGTADILLRQSALLATRAGKALELVAVSARDKNKKRPVDLGKIRFESDPLKLVADDVDVVVELIGGADGVAKELVESAITHGKSVVTANKALIAKHGMILAALAEKHGVVLAYEAAVAGGIPIIKALRDGLAANRITRIEGILNGTSNFILTEMARSKRGFAEVLKDAQAKGYAEADPSFDIDGVDAAHKLAILTSLAFGTAPSLDKIHIEGIRNISLKDMEYAEQLGYRIKLLAIAEQHEQSISQRVYPCLIPLKSSLAHVHDVFNAISVEGDACGRMFIEGRGAGAGPTASSVVADIMDIARGVRYNPFTLPVAQLKLLKEHTLADQEFAYYLRLSVADKPGVLAEITALFTKHGISIYSMVQHAHAADEPVQVILTTHKAKEASMSQAISAITALSALMHPPQLIRIEAL